MLYALDDLISRILEAWKTRACPCLKKVASLVKDAFSFESEMLRFSRYPFFQQFQFPRPGWRMRIFLHWLRCFVFDMFTIIGGAALIAVIWYFCFTF